MQPVFLFLADGFEEIEAIATIDILRRAGITVKTISITHQKSVTGAHQITLEADTTFEAQDFSNGAMLILPGGMPGTENLQQYKPLNNLINQYFQDGKYLAAICAAPLVFGQMGLLKDKKATCYPGFENKLTGAILSSQNVIVDGQFITSCGPGTVFPFALKLVEVLKTKNSANEVANGMLLI